MTGLSSTLAWTTSADETPPAVVLDPALRSELNRIQVTSLIAHTSTASLISTVAALILAIYLAPAVGILAAQIWFGLKVASALPRFVVAHAYKRGLWRPSVTRATNVVVASLAVDGAIWGLSGIWCASWQSEATAGLLLGCLSSVAMLATFGLQVKLRATGAFVAPLMLPMAAALALRGDMLGITGAGGALLVLVQTIVTGYASEKRVTREFLSREQVARALTERSAALRLASKTAGELEEALDQVRRQSAVKALFLGTMSHELRTPLHGILGLTEMVQRQISDPKLLHQLDLVRSSGNHLLELIGALLDVTRIDTERLALHPAPLDLRLELRNLADLYELRAGSKGIGFQAAIEIDDACWVRGDAARLRQILHNLLGNAIKFTRRGFVRLTVKRQAASFVFEITDTGPGISADDLPHIFEAFRQAGDSAARPADGTGLGLTIARELARAMGGDIAVGSAIGVGSRFVFSAPLETLAPAEIPSAAGVPASMPPRLTKSLRILLVEDNDVNALIAQSHLDRLGVQTLRAHDGRQALEASIAAERPDLVLMDCRMPVMDGLEATREIRAAERRAGLRRVPIVALTATPSDEDRAECFAAGMDGFLTKPFDDA
ncbi:MAG: ATP-binding protein, partial [Caldimonas sp.]